MLWLTFGNYNARSDQGKKTGAFAWKRGWKTVEPHRENGKPVILVHALRMKSAKNAQGEEGMRHRTPATGQGRDGMPTLPGPKTTFSRQQATQPLRAPW